MVYPKYSPASLEAILKKYFGRTKVYTALTPLLISSYDLNSQRPFFFKSNPIPGTNEDNANKNHSWEVTTIARATSAAPTFLPPIQIPDAKKPRLPSKQPRIHSKSTLVMRKPLRASARAIGATAAYVRESRGPS